MNVGFKKPGDMYLLHEQNTTRLTARGILGLSLLCILEAGQALAKLA
jgi:hypothetical protein